MNGTPFKLATLAKPGGSAFAAIVLGDNAVDLSAAHEAYRASGRGGALSATDSIQGLLEDWEANFRRAAGDRGLPRQGGLKPGAAALTSLHALPPVARPGKMFYAAQNFQEHVDEMLRAGMTPASGPKFTGEKSTTQPYLFLKAPSCLAGANRRHRDPARPEEDRLGGRDRAAPSASPASTSRPSARSITSPAG